MYSLYHSLLAQHSRQLTPVRCAPSTIAQLHRYFEDVVLENNLGALVVESLPSSGERTAREIARARGLEKTTRNLFLFLGPDDALNLSLAHRAADRRKAVVLQKSLHDESPERFVVIADARFSALLATIKDPELSKESPGEPVVWTFEPDIVYSALEYLMARVTAQHPFHAPVFAKAVGVSMPKATSLQLTLGVTTKLARLLQEQAEREIAVNRIATTIRNSLELESVLQTAANEVGRALNATCAVRVEGDALGRQMTKYHFQKDSESEEQLFKQLLGDLDEISAHVSVIMRTQVVDGDHSADELTTVHAAVPLILNGGFAGMVLVRSEDPARIWGENELLLLHTVADQLAVAVNQAHLFAQMQQQALTDSLTDCYNRRSFELQLERDLHLAMRMRQSLSLIMIDLDNFKEINDAAGHGTGDLALRMFADTLRQELRAVDTAARYGGDEFVVILPQANSEGALIVAERLREKIEKLDVPGFGPVTASFGMATFPIHASSRDSLVLAADRALYESKYSGRNRVSLPPVISEAFPKEENPTFGQVLDVINHR
ncbi:MAG TPA: sensor domain-containing diguanylate cyclase [Pyrinomonadaceae bacterium]|nr:sensor domain-containing diguanylate cyclase [Pyrinomonadaceae bacterium]